MFMVMPRDFERLNSEPASFYAAARPHGRTVTPITPP
jgi:hypothetical protein